VEKVSTAWKKSAMFFHGMEKRFPQSTLHNSFPEMGRTEPAPPDQPQTVVVAAGGATSVLPGGRMQEFPRHGKIRREFSTVWKTFFHAVENQRHPAGRGAKT
jgi:hypothetical protein